MLETLTRTQNSLLASYSSPFVLLSALVINIWLVSTGVSSGILRLVFLGAAVPIGFFFGRLIYLKRSHVEIAFDEKEFRVKKGNRETLGDNWKNYKIVSIRLDQFGRPDLRLYKSADGDFVDLPISRTNADPQKFREHVQGLLSRRVATPSLQLVEAS